MSVVPIEPEFSEVASGPLGSRCFDDLRGVRWRVDLGILPSSFASVDDIRRVTADSRRRYAALRKQLLVDPHVKKDECSSPDLVIDNPLSQNPDSTWGQFFRNAELEKMVDQDLSRLYPERGSYFQTNEWKGMLRRILLLWCLNNPEYGYRQGMHELLAPLLYVLHVDVQRLAEVRQAYADHFTDNFDDFSYHGSGSKNKFDLQKFSESLIGESKLGTTYSGACGPNELDPLTHTIILISDCYGAESELGILLSRKFMEHDAYSMFDALMSGGGGGGIAMVDFYSPSPSEKSHSGFTPVIEASAEIYHLLSVVDASLHSHLVELGVEPQYFSLRWLRVLFGREFSLENLLLIWDEILARDNTECDMAAGGYAGSNGILGSPRGAFISAFAVSMIFHLRSSLLATENATACLQRLLSFPDDINLERIMMKATSLKSLAADANSSNSFFHALLDVKNPMVSRGHSLSPHSTSPRTHQRLIPESYWEEKWRDLHMEERGKDSVQEEVPAFRKHPSERVKLRLSRTESDPTPSKKNEKGKSLKSSVRINLLKDLARHLGDEDEETCSSDDTEHRYSAEPNTQAVSGNISSGRLSVTGSQESTHSSDPPSHVHKTSDLDNDLESISSALGSSTVDKDSDLSASNLLHNSEISQGDVPMVKSAKRMEDGRTLSAKFQWLWKFGRNVSDGTTERQSAPDDTKSCYDVGGEAIATASSAADRFDGFSSASKGEEGQQTLLVASLSHLGQSMLENIKVLESFLHEDSSLSTGSLETLPKYRFVGEGQVAAISSALKELRKISHLLSEL